MPSHQGFSAWVHVKGHPKPLEELDIQVKKVNGSPEVSCYIPIAEGKVSSAPFDAFFPWAKLSVEVQSLLERRFV